MVQGKFLFKEFTKQCADEIASEIEKRGTVLKFMKLRLIKKIIHKHSEKLEWSIPFKKYLEESVRPAVEYVLTKEGYL